MSELVQRVFLFTLVASIVAYMIFLLVGAALYAEADEKARTVWIRDEISPNTHRIAGLVTVPSSCTELSHKTEQVTPLLFKLKFKTWEHPNTECLHESVQKEFHEVIFAPAVGVHFIATLDDVPLPIIVVPYVP